VMSNIRTLVILCVAEPIGGYQSIQADGESNSAIIIASVSSGHLLGILH